MVKTPNSSTPTAVPPLIKRKRDSEEDSESAQSKKTRSRVSFSCGECHRRKQKCDRQVPCSHCVARKVPELCKAYTPGKTDQDSTVRLARLEHVVRIALPQFAHHLLDSGSMSHMRMGSPGLDDDAHSQNEEQDPHGGTFQSGKWYGNSASGSVATASVLEQLANAVAPQSPTYRAHSRHNSSSGGEVLRPGNGQGPHHITTTGLFDSVRDDSEPSAADKLKSLVQDCGVSPHKISELLQELPPQRFSDVLIDYYFTSINWTRYPVSEADFRTGYTSVCANGIGANPNDIRFLPLLFVVLSIAVRLAPEHIAGDGRTRRLTSLRYYWSSRRSVLIAAAIQPDSLEMVLTRLLSARYLTFDRRITECWSQLGAAVRTAQALGLHRDAAPLGMDPLQVEYRRRIWSYLYHADRSYALVLGRPNAIQDDYTSTLPPLNIDDDFLTTQIRDPPPLTIPTPMTFVILRHKIAAIIGRMVHHFQQVRAQSHYSDVLSLDDELLKFINNLPPHFSLEPDTSLDSSMKFIPVHRFLLITEILFIRVSLHRPYLLRRLGSDRYARSRSASFESAIRDFRVRQAFRHLMSNEVEASLSNAYREFQTAMMAGIYLVINPKGGDAEQMHTILDTFVKDHDGVREMDETTRRELKTVEFLKNKASQANEGTSPDGIGGTDTGSSAGNNEPIDAHLLLGLQQSASRPPSGANFSLLSTGQSASQKAGPLSGTGTSPSIPFAIANSPTIQRLQGDGFSANSPANSGSPTADDESAAQSLLDHWCNSVSSTDGLTGASTGLSWGAGSTSNDFPMSMWATGNPPLMGGEPSSSGSGNLVGGQDGSDWTYWETLVNQIRAGP